MGRQSLNAGLSNSSSNLHQTDVGMEECTGTKLKTEDWLLKF